MTANYNYDWVKLETPEDYKFFACVVAEKLRNNQFESSRREVFLKTLLEEIKPVCTYQAYNRIEKFLNEVASQKHVEQKAELAKAEEKSGIKKNTKATLAVEKKVRNHKVNMDQDSLSDSDDDDFV